ncbi:MAG: serine/threonine protein kinase, partial [Gemmataceae bacterium]|nr:serine/threonine protein kinase [Gemmataceae bacterium]
MLRLLTCSQGHFWESAEATACPQCGAPPDSLPLLDLEGDAPAPPPAGPPPAAEAELRVAGYETLEELGKGPTGLRLSKARHKATGRLVLLEAVLAREDSSQHAWASLRSQAAALARVAHPGIVGLLDAGERDRQLFYNALEWVEGPTLAQKVANKRLPPRQAVRLVETLARVVDHAHAAGVIHRSLRPSAVLLQMTALPKDMPARDDPPGPACWLHASAHLPRLADFGLVRRSVEGEAVDLPLYGDEAGFLSPEQAWGRAKEFGPPTDVWGLGAILHFLLTGRAPYEGKSPADIVEAIQAGEPPRVGGVPSGLRAILSK